MNPEKQKPEEEKIPPGKTSAPPHPGAQLRRYREARGLSLNAVSQETRIPIKFLNAIEAGDSAPFPARSYFRGFLESYCGFLGADFESLWREILAAEDAQKKAQAPEPQPRPSQPKVSAPTPVAVAAAAVVVLIAVGIFYAAKSGGAPAQRPAPGAPLQEARPAKRGAPGAADAVVLSFAKDSWVSLSVDGKPYFDGRVPAGAMNVSVRQTLKLRTSQPGDLSLKVNERPTPLPPASPDGSYTLRRNGLLP